MYIFDIMGLVFAVDETFTTTTHFLAIEAAELYLLIMVLTCVQRSELRESLKESGCLLGD